MHTIRVDRKRHGEKVYVIIGGRSNTARTVAESPQRRTVSLSGEETAEARKAAATCHIMQMSTSEDCGLSERNIYKKKKGKKKVTRQNVIYSFGPDARVDMSLDLNIIYSI